MGTGVPLAREGCLSKEKWISPGILGELLMETHENQTMFPMVEQVKSQSPIQPGASTLLGVTNLTLLGITHSASNVAADPTMLSVHTSSVTMTTLPANNNKKNSSNIAPAASNDGITPEIVTSQVATAHSNHLQSHHHPTDNGAIINEQPSQVNENPTISADNAVMEVS